MKPGVMLLIAVQFGLMADSYREAFQEGYTYTAEPTAIYDCPDQLSDTAALVPTGEVIIVTGLSSVIETGDGNAWGWYEAEWHHEFGSVSGYVFQRDLPVSYLAPGDGSIFVYMPGESVEDSVTGVVSVILSGEVQADLPVRPNWLEPLQPVSEVNFCLLDATGLTGVRNLVSLYSGYSTMEGRERQYLLVWTDDGRLIEGPQALGVASGGPTKYWTEVILPSDEGGENDRIFLNLLGEVYDTDTDSWELIIDELDTYLWTGDGFIKN